MNELIVFNLADELYGIELTKVREIKTYEEPTPLPNTKSFVNGVINIRGEIVPVIDLNLRFDESSAPEYYDTTPVITTKTSDSRMIAVIVDAIDTLAYFSPNDMIELSTEGLFINREFIQGIAHVDGRNVIVIDVDKMFSQEEILNY